MRTDAQIKIEGFQALGQRLDLVEVERFVVMLNREKFDYTKWRQNLFENMSIEEISAAAEKYSREKYPT
jgi:hypothetical protein